MAVECVKFVRDCVIEGMMCSVVVLLIGVIAIVVGDMAKFRVDA